MWNNYFVCLLSQYDLSIAGSKWLTSREGGWNAIAGDSIAWLPPAEGKQASMFEAAVKAEYCSFAHSIMLKGESNELE